jgi:hypothetical protein
VNVLRHVFSHYFGADLPPRENALYFSTLERPYQIVPLGPDYRVIDRSPRRAAAGAATAGRVAARSDSARVGAAPR